MTRFEQLRHELGDLAASQGWTQTRDLCVSAEFVPHLIAAANGVDATHLRDRLFPAAPIIPLLDVGFPRRVNSARFVAVAFDCRQLLSAEETQAVVEHLHVRPPGTYASVFLHPETLDSDEG